MLFFVSLDVVLDRLFALAQSAQVVARERIGKLIHFFAVVDGLNGTADEFAPALRYDHAAIFAHRLAVHGGGGGACRIGFGLVLVVKPPADCVTHIGIDEFIERPLAVIEPYEEGIRATENDHHEYGDDEQEHDVRARKQQQKEGPKRDRRKQDRLRKRADRHDHGIAEERPRTLLIVDAERQHPHADGDHECDEDIPHHFGSNQPPRTGRADRNEIIGKIARYARQKQHHGKNKQRFEHVEIIAFNAAHEVVCDEHAFRPNEVADNVHTARKPHRRDQRSGDQEREP